MTHKLQRHLKHYLVLFSFFFSSSIFAQLSPSVSLTLSSLYCDSLSDLTIGVSQDPGEADMSDVLFTSNSGSFAISSMNVGDTIGSASMTAGGGFVNYSTVLLVSSVVSSSQAIVESIDLSSGLSLGTFTLNNTVSGVSIYEVVPPDNNTVTSGNSQSITFNNIFQNPGQGPLVFTSTINSELGDRDVQTFTKALTCLCPTVYFSNTLTICNGDSVLVGTNVYSSQGTYIDTLVSVNGCDSIITTTLFSGIVGCTNPNSINYDPNAVCDDGSCIAIIYGCTDSNACNYLSSANVDNGSCLYDVFSFYTATSCDSYNWNGVTYNTSGVYVWRGISLFGCDSVVTLNLTINKSSSSTTSVTLCDTNYFWNGVTYTSSGVYTWIGTNASGCDSTATLNLTINNSSSSTTSVTSCDSLVWNGVTYTNSGVYTWIGTNAIGCDSTATLNLTINNSSSSTTSVTTCGGYLWNGSVYMQSGVYTYSTKTINGCDSTATLNLTVNSSSTSFTGVTACDSYSWNGTTYTRSGVYTYKTVNVYGCDSTANLALVIFNTDSNTINVTACNSYDWNGVNYNSSGLYTWVGRNVAGCDSIVTLNLTINKSSSSTTSVTSCDSLVWNGVTYTSSGVYTWIGTNASGCDSTATLNLTINNSSFSTTIITACDSFSWNGVTYKNSGIYNYKIQKTSGSYVSTPLTFTYWGFRGLGGQPSNTNNNEDAVGYTWGGSNWNDMPKTNSFKHIMETYSNLGAIPGYSYMGTYNNSHYYRSNTSSSWSASKITAENAGGHLLIEDDLQEHNAVASMHAAIGWNPVWIGLYQDYSDPNYREPDGGWKWVEKYTPGNTGNTAGCDSTATLILTINKSSSSTTSVTACDSLVWNGTTYTSSGVYTWLGTSTYLSV